MLEVPLGTTQTFAQNTGCRASAAKRAGVDFPDLPIRVPVRGLLGCSHRFGSVFERAEPLSALRARPSSLDSLPVVTERARAVMDLGERVRPILVDVEGSHEG